MIGPAVLLLALVACTGAPQDDEQVRPAVDSSWNVARATAPCCGDVAMAGPAGSPEVSREARPAASTDLLALEPGLYRCELDRRVVVRRIAQDGRSAVLNWSSHDYTLRRVPSRSGAVRLEDPNSGLAWIVIVGKSILLDMKKGQQLANECKL